MRTRASHSRFGFGPARQTGMVATFVAVIVLIATLMAAIALMRSVDTTTTIATSLTFRQGVIQEAERAYEAVKAANQIPFSGPLSEVDNASVGYSSFLLVGTTSRKYLPDVLVNATATSCSSPCVSMPAGSTDNQVRDVVERLCPQTGPADPKTCIVPGAVVQGSQTTDAGSKISTGAVLAGYRLSVRVDGPKNTVGYVQTILR
jgi:type IV pilus assembly protein PilX